MPRLRLLAAAEEPERLLLDDDVLLVTLAPDERLLLFTFVLLVFTVLERSEVELRTFEPEVTALFATLLIARLTADPELFFVFESDVLILAGCAVVVLGTTGIVYVVAERPVAVFTAGDFSAMLLIPSLLPRLRPVERELLPDDPDEPDRCLPTLLLPVLPLPEEDRVRSTDELLLVPVLEVPRTRVAGTDLDEVEVLFPRVIALLRVRVLVVFAFRSVPVLVRLFVKPLLRGPFLYNSAVWLYLLLR